MSKLKSIEYTAIYFNELRELPEDFFKSNEVKMSEELKPCPFCGEAPAKSIGRELPNYFEHDWYVDSDDSIIEIECINENCAVNPGVLFNCSHEIEEAIEAWNRRAE